jgi:hypothetical protein
MRGQGGLTAKVLRSAEPIGAPVTVARYTLKLVEALCEALEVKGLGARKLDLRFHRVDNRIEVIRVGTAVPVGTQPPRSTSTATPSPSGPRRPAAKAERSYDRVLISSQGGSAVMTATTSSFRRLTD